MVSEAEKRSYGWLGKPPPELWDASYIFVRKWKNLERRCREVARMWNGTARAKAALDIERERRQLVQDIKREAYYRNHKDTEDT